MYRIRFHGRGGQGIKTASRILGSAFFIEGFEVQDSPSYGAERRGAPISASVRAGRETVNERGPVDHPDLVIVADESLLQVPQAGVMIGLHESTVLVIASADSPEAWCQRLAVPGTVLTLSFELGDPSAQPSAACVGAAAGLVGCISPASLEDAIRTELADFPSPIVEHNVALALESYSHFEALNEAVTGSPEPPLSETVSPDWVELEAEPVDIAAPDIHAGATSERVRTGLWRTLRPVIDDSRCRGCTWICSTLCPDAAIDVSAEHRPVIDYDHCKGCMLCAAVCPSHAIAVEPEVAAAATERES